MKTELDTIREALTDGWDLGIPEKRRQALEALAALSTMTDEQKLAEKYRLIALMNFETAFWGVGYQIMRIPSNC